MGQAFGACPEAPVLTVLLRRSVMSAGSGKNRTRSIEVWKTPGHRCRCRRCAFCFGQENSRRRRPDRQTADKLGVGVEELQRMRYAADLSGISTQTFDMALQRFTRRAAEAAAGTGEAKDALAALGIQLIDANGNSVLRDPAG